MRHCLPGKGERAFKDKHCFQPLRSAHENTVAPRSCGTCPKSHSTDQARHRPQARQKKGLISWFSRMEKRMISRFPSSTRSVQSKSLPSRLPPRVPPELLTVVGQWSGIRPPTYVRRNYPAHRAGRALAQSHRRGWQQGQRCTHTLPRTPQALLLPRPLWGKRGTIHP